MILKQFPNRAHTHYSSFKPSETGWTLFLVIYIAADLTNLAARSL